MIKTAAGSAASAATAGAASGGGGFMLGFQMLADLLQKRREVERKLKIQLNKEKEARKEVERYRGIIYLIHILT